jgi:hypothetical protein
VSFATRSRYGPAAPSFVVVVSIETEWKLPESIESEGDAEVI